MSKQIYLFYGSDSFIIKTKTNQLIKKEDIDGFNVSVYDAEEVNIEDAINDASTIPFMSDKKIIVVKNAHFLSTIALKKAINHNLDSLIRYIDNPVEETILIIQAPYGKLDERKAITKAILADAIVEKCEPMKRIELGSWIKRQLGKNSVSIDNDALEEMLNRIDSNTEVLVSETQKLSLYSDDLSRVTKEIVQKVVTKNVEDNVYEITNNILEGKTSKALEIYNDLVMHSEDPLRILGILATKYREILHTKLLLNAGKDKNEIATYFNATSGRTYYIMKNASSVRMDVVESQLQKLEELDYQIKTGQIDKKIGLELFILGT